MNYEELYQNIVVLEKEIKDRQASGLKIYKKLSQDSEKGDLKNYAKNLAQLQALTANQTELLAQLGETVNSFDTKAYVDSGDFAEQMVYECRTLSVDVKGDFPIYEMFPYRVRIDAENQDVYVDRKKWQCLRPITFAKEIAGRHDYLLRTQIRAAVECLDQLYQYGTTDDVSVGELSQSGYEEDLPELDELDMPVTNG